MNRAGVGDRNTSTAGRMDSFCTVPVSPCARVPPFSTRVQSERSAAHARSLLLLTSSSISISSDLGMFIALSGPRISS